MFLQCKSKFPTFNWSRFRKHVYKVVDQICDYYARLNDLPVVAQVEPGYLVNDLPSKDFFPLQTIVPELIDIPNNLVAEAPTNPEDFSLVASDFQTKILPGITHWGHPRFFAYFPAITNFESILADMMATSVSNPGFNVSMGRDKWKPASVLTQERE